MSRTLVWETSLPAPECRLRLAHYTEVGTIWRGLRGDPKGTVYLWMRGNSFQLFAKGAAFIRNSYEPYFYGSITEADGRTIIRGCFRMHPFVRIFTAVWFFGAVTIGGLLTVVMLYEIVTGRRVSTGNMPPALAALIGPAMLTFGVALLAFGWRMGRPQRKRIEQFLETTLAAHRLTSQSSGPAGSRCSPFGR